MKSTPFTNQTPLKMLSTVSSTIQNPPKNFSNLLFLEEKNQTKELFQAVMAFKNPKNLKQISEDTAKEQIISEVIRICNKLLTELIEEVTRNSSASNGAQEIMELVETLLSLSEIHDSQLVNGEVAFLNNLCSFHLISRNATKAKECLKTAEKLVQKTTRLALWGLTYNNLATLALMNQDYLQSYKDAERTLFKIESSLFKRLKENSRPDQVCQIPEFMNELLFVLNGYLNLAISLEHLRKNPSLLSKSDKITQKDPKIFYQNGHKLSLKYLSEDHPLTRKFNHLLSHGIEEHGLNLKPLSYNHDLEDSDENQQVQGSFLKNFESFDRNSETEDGVFNKKGKAFRVQTRKNLDSRTKSLNKVRTQIEDEEDNSSQVNYTTTKLNKSHNDEFPFQKQMKELEKTVKEMKKLKEKYEKSESTLFLHKNLELLFQQKELEEFIAKRRDFHSSMIYPTNTTSSLFYAPQQPAPPFLGLSKAPAPTIDPNVEMLMQKQQEMEATLMTIRRDNIKIMQEKDEKAKELQRLQDYVLKLEAERASMELEKKMLKEKEQHNPRTPTPNNRSNDMNLAPIGSMNNLNESNLSEASSKTRGKYSSREDRKFNIPLDNLKKEEKKETKKNEPGQDVKSMMKRSTPTNHFPPSQKQISLPSDPSKNPNNVNPAPKTIVPLKKSSSRTMGERRSSNDRNKQERAPQEGSHDRQRSLAAEKATEKSMTQEKPDNTSFAPLSQQKRGDSIKKILIDFKGLNKHYNTNESLKKQDSTTSMDLALEVLNPSHMLKTTLSLIMRNVVVRKKVFIDNKLFIFELRIIVENEGHLFRLLAFYESSGKPAIKEEILNITLIHKILQNIDFRDVIPLIFPLKTIFSVMKFSRYFFLPFLGIGEARSPVSEEAANDRKVEIWPKAHGLIDKNIKIAFMGDEFFLFFHFLANDSFRLVLSNAKNGMTVRIEYQFDPSSLKKYFESLEIGKSQNEEIADLVRVVEILEDEDISEEMIREAQSIIAKYLQNRGENEIFIENYRVLDLNAFIAFLEKTIKDFEELLKSRGFMTLGPLLSDEKTRLFKIKVWHEGNRFRFGMVIENIEKREFEIVLKNGFESHAPMKKMVKALGVTTFPFEAIWKNFGLVFNRMDMSDKYLIAGIILDSYVLEIHEKVLDKDDWDRYDPNPIICQPLECGGFFRTFIGKQYKYPLTLSLIGYQGVPVGIKAVIFDPLECKENGMFFSLNSELWKKKNLNENKKKNNKYLSVIPIEGDYHLHFVLEKVGFKALLNSIQFERVANGSVDTLGKSLIKGNMSVVDCLENVLSLPIILEIYRAELKEE